MAVSRRTVSLVRSLAIFHIVVGALLIILGIADGVTSLATARYVFWTGYVFFGVWIGTWVSFYHWFQTFSNFAFARNELAYFPVSESESFFLPSSLLACRGKNRLENESKVLRVHIVESCEGTRRRKQDSVHTLIYARYSEI